MQPPPLKAEGRQCPRLFQREGREGFNPAPAIGFLTATLFRTKAPLGGVSQRSSAHSGQIAILIHYYVVESDLADYFLFFKGPRHHKKKSFWRSHVRLRESPSPLGPSNNTCHRNPYLYNTGGSLSGEEGISSTNFFFVGLFGTLGSAGPHGAGEPSVPNHGPVDPCRIFGANKKRGR
jgi:hypothetical protein|uniref:Uncharacterized protein n=4 Tax=Populus TaxID=3689 RepID=A0A343DRC3_9ROSI|nr:hypothetical protein [Populus davidiana]ALP00623.1 hypothetical protein [Populus tremula]ALP46555.1 hypothetical protein [Populus tremula x Populus alba]QTG40196.1 hypothetical protein [Populus rotundifolia var. duclouxiana]UZA66006.1 hypothetical protein Potri.00MG000043 [Populus trichocarpa]UZA66057.1 hypothetical protein Podel.00MG000043 [Populus deltoides]